MSLAADYKAFCVAHPAVRHQIAGAMWQVIAAGDPRQPAVLLLPGGFGVAETSFGYQRALAQDYFTLALTYPPHLATIAQFAEGIAALLAAYDLPAVHILGGSASGAIAQVFVRRFPKRTASLILAQTRAPTAAYAARSAAIARIIISLPAPLLLALMRWAVWGFLPHPDTAQHFWRDHFTQIIAAQTRATIAARFAVLADYDRHYHFTPSDLIGWHGQITLIEAAADRFIAPPERFALRALYPQAVCVALAAQGHAASVTEIGPQLAVVQGAIMSAVGTSRPFQRTERRRP